jgi:hypothetical protein
LGSPRRSAGWGFLERISLLRAIRGEKNSESNRQGAKIAKQIHSVDLRVRSLLR